MIRRKQKRSALGSKSVTDTAGAREPGFDGGAPQAVPGVKRKPTAAEIYGGPEVCDDDDDLDRCKHSLELSGPWIRIDGAVGFGNDEHSGQQMERERPFKTNLSQEDSQQSGATAEQGAKHDDRPMKGFRRIKKNDSGMTSEDSDQGTVNETIMCQRKKARGESAYDKTRTSYRNEFSSAFSMKENQTDLFGEGGNDFSSRDGFQQKTSNRWAGAKDSGERGLVDSQRSQKASMGSKSLLDVQEDGELAMLMDDLAFHIDGFENIDDDVNLKTIRSNVHGLEKFCSDKEHVAVLRQSKVARSIVSCCKTSLRREDVCQDSETAKNIAKIIQVVITNSRKEVVVLSRDVLLCLISLLRQHKRSIIERDLLFTVCMLKAACIEASALADDMLPPDVFHLFTELGLISMAASTMEIALGEYEWRLDHASDSGNSALHSLCFWTDILADTAGYSPESFEEIISRGNMIRTTVHLVDITRRLWDQDSYTINGDVQSEEPKADDWEDVFASQPSAPRGPSAEQIDRCRNFSEAVCCGLIRVLMNLSNRNIIVCKDISVQGGVEALKSVVEHAWKLPLTEGLEDKQKQLAITSSAANSDTNQSFSHPYNSKFEELGVTAMLALVNIAEMDKGSLFELGEEKFMKLLVDVLDECSKRILDVIKRSLSESQNKQLSLGLDGSKDEAFFKTLLSSSNEGLMVEVKYEGSAAVLLAMVYLRSNQSPHSIYSSEEDAPVQRSNPEMFRHVSKSKLIKVLRRFHRLLDMSGSSSSSTADSLCEIIHDLESI